MLLPVEDMVFQQTAHNLAVNYYMLWMKMKSV